MLGPRASRQVLSRASPLLRSTHHAAPTPDHPSEADLRLHRRLIEAAAYGHAEPFPAERSTSNLYVSTYPDQGFKGTKHRGLRGSGIELAGEVLEGRQAEREKGKGRSKSVERVKSSKWRVAAAKQAGLGSSRPTATSSPSASEAGPSRRSFSTSPLPLNQRPPPPRQSQDPSPPSARPSKRQKAACDASGEEARRSLQAIARRASANRRTSKDALIASLSRPSTDRPELTRNSRNPHAKRTSEPVSGDWLEVRRNGAVTCSGLYLGPGLEPRLVLVLVKGSNAIETVKAEDITFIIPSFIDRAYAASALPPGFTPESNPVLDTPESTSMVQQLRQFDSRVEAATTFLVGRGAKDLYRVTADRKSITALEAFSLLHLAPPHPDRMTRKDWEIRLAMHQLLMDDPEHFVADAVNHKASGVFSVKEEQEVEGFDVVRGWVRERSGEMLAFAEKAARVREWGRTHPATYKAGALERWTLPDGMDWTRTDISIIRFLRLSLRNERLIQPQPYLAIAPSILKLVDRASSAIPDAVVERHLEIGRPRIMAFLAEIGTVAPWENWVAHEGDGILAKWDASFPPPRPSSSSPSTTPSRIEFLTLDPHDAVRKDFGQLPVYTIDDAGAKELDDGISLEEGPATASGGASWWIHVHVADPTALLHPGHEIALVAQERDHTEYFPEKTWPMLPEWFVEREGMSLGSKDGQEQKTLSISVRVDEGGEVLETDVKAGIIRVVRRLTYAGVDQVLGHVPPPPSLVLTEPFLPSDFILPSSSSARATDDSTLPSDPKALSDLSTLYRLAGQALKRRVAANALYWNFAASSVSVSPSLSHHYDISPTPSFYSTSPLISLTLPSSSPSALLTPAQLLVSEWMVVANRAAAKFCVERGLPVPFRSQLAPQGQDETVARLLALRDPTTGELPARAIFSNAVDFKPASLGLSPGPHWPMGIQDEFGYVKVTSPLRRYSDMFCHWQIKSALLPSSSSSSPTFSRPAVARAIESFERINKARGRTDRPANAFWSLYLLQKKLDILRTDPSQDPVASFVLENLSAVAMRAPSFNLVDGAWFQPVLISELGIRAQLRTKNEEDGPRAGEEAKVRIVEILLSGRSRAIVEVRE